LVAALAIPVTLLSQAASPEANASASGDAVKPESASVARPGRHSETSIRPFSTVGIGVKASLLGPGIEVATPLGNRTNLRIGFNDFGYSRTFQNNGINYVGTLRLRSTEALLDWYPFKSGFHISPGALIHNGNQIAANASAPAGSIVTLNSVDYVSSSIDPVKGTGKLDFRPAAPMVLFGFGNLVPRTKHFSVPFELGAVFQGTARTTLNLTGSICDVDATNCRAISSDPTVQSNIRLQQDKINQKLNAFQYYPVISVGFAYKF
jgi:hypothetical protein